MSRITWLRNNLILARDREFRLFGEELNSSEDGLFIDGEEKLSQLSVWKTRIRVNPGYTLLGIFGLIYVVCMFAYPWATLQNWKDVQAVWDRWQSLNVGALALVSSILVLESTKYAAEKQRQREFVAARAFLPRALSELTLYFKSCASVLDDAWWITPAHTYKVPHVYRPDSFKEIFRDCIRHADREVGDYLTNILTNLQIHEARFESVVENLTQKREHSNKLALLAYLYELGRLQAWVNYCFPFARGEKPLSSVELNWPEMHTAYAIMDLHEEKFQLNETMNLEIYTKKYLEKQKQV